MTLELAQGKVLRRRFYGESKVAWVLALKAPYKCCMTEAHWRRPLLIILSVSTQYILCLFGAKSHICSMAIYLFECYQWWRENSIVRFTKLEAMFEVVCWSWTRIKFTLEFILLAFCELICWTKVLFWRYFTS